MLYTSSLKQEYVHCAGHECILWFLYESVHWLGVCVCVVFNYLGSTLWILRQSIMLKVTSPGITHCSLVFSIHDTLFPPFFLVPFAQILALLIGTSFTLCFICPYKYRSSPPFSCPFHMNLSPSLCQGDLHSPFQMLICGDMLIWCGYYNCIYWLRALIRMMHSFEHLLL